MRELILEWYDLWIPEYRRRHPGFDVFEGDVKKVTLLTGCRRSGKTYLMYQLIDELQSREGVDRRDIVYLNFEDERVEWDTKVLTDLLPTLVELNGERDYHLFLDEVHHIPNWDRWVRRVHDSNRNITIYLTSSSSKLSKKEIPNALRGRTLPYEVFPLSFEEFMSFKDRETEDPTRLTDIDRAKIRALFSEYLDYGGFPEVVLEGSERRKKGIIQDYFRTIITLDICERYGISNTKLMHDYVKLILNQTSHSTTKFYNTLRSQGINVGKDTLLTYTHHLEEAYLSFFVPIFSYKIKDRLYYPRKVYFIDGSFLNHITLKTSPELGRQMENAVYLRLLKRYDVENIFYWKDSKNHEVDFVIVEGGRVIMAIQVCHDLTDEKTREREVRSLVSGARELNCTELLLISGEKVGEEEIDGHSIRYVPLYRWLLE